jgi:hypothetical protein
MSMEAQHNDESRFDGLDASFEINDSGAWKARIRMSKEALGVLAFGGALYLSKGETRERLLDAVPALAQRFGGRLFAAA